MDFKTAVAIPCYNEEASIAKVVKDFQKALPGALICVFNNQSTDQSREMALQAGARVIDVPRKGKGHVVRSIFRVLIDHDAVVMVDGDDTYFADDMNAMIAKVENDHADMVVGNRLQETERKSFKKVRYIGNRMITQLLNSVLGSKFQDVLSGYRVFSRDFLKKIPLLTNGFEIEVELTLQAVREGMLIEEVPVAYKPRVMNSHSKLRPFNDGWRIVFAIAMLLRDHQPFRVYGFSGIVCWLVALWASVLKILNVYGATAFSDSLLAGLILLFAPLGAILFSVALILSAVDTRVKETRQLINRQGRSTE